MTKLPLPGVDLLCLVIARPTGSAVAIHLAGLLRRALRATPRNDKSGRFLLLALAVLVLAGCTTPTTTSPKGPPASLGPAAPVVVLPPASITGSEEKSTMLDNFTVFIVAVDGVPVAAGRAGWSAVLPLPAGPRRLTLAFNRGVFTARTEVAFTATSQAAYQVKFATDAQIFGKNTYCEFWIVDTATGAAVTERQRVPLARTESAK